MSTAGYAVRETDPFTDRPAVALSFRESSPYVNRIRILWRKMRDPVIESFPEAPGLPRNRAAYMKRVERAYVTDAWHSLSIEGYRVTPELIERFAAARGIPTRMSRTASSATQWRRADTGRHSNSCRKASGRC
jgi:hypothetical protein